MVGVGFIQVDPRLTSASVETAIAARVREQQQQEAEIEQALTVSRPLSKTIKWIALAAMIGGGAAFVMNRLKK